MLIVKYVDKCIRVSKPMDLNWISTLGYLHPREIDFSFDKSNYVGTIKLLSL